MQGIEEWLDKLGLGGYQHAFEQQQITLALLQDLMDQDLKEIGVVALGHRKILLKAIAQMKAGGSSETALHGFIEKKPVPQTQDTTSGERRQLTVLFCDMVGFTELANRVDPEVLQKIIRACKRRHLRVALVDLPRDLPLLYVDPVLFEQVLINLLENAARHTPAGTAIAIAARADEERSTIEIADCGPGIPEGSSERIFGKFQRGHDAAAGGVGLGLAICRGIVEAHGGTIRAGNREGGGAVFTVTLPREKTTPSEEPK